MNKRYRGYILTVCCLVLVVGCAVIAGWLFNIRLLTSIVPHYVAMKFNTAICFILLSLSLLIYAGKTGNRWRTISGLLAVGVFAIAGLTLSQFFFNYNLGIDELFVIDLYAPVENNPNPGRMSPVTAFCFCALAVFAFYANSRHNTYRDKLQWLLHVVTAMSFVAILGYLFAIPVFYKLWFFSSLAVHTSIAFFLLSMAASLINPTLGITGLFTGNKIGNVMARRVFWQMVVAILVLGYLRLLGHRYSMVNVEFGIALFSTSFIITSLFVIWSAANELNKIDFQKNEAENSLARVKTFLDSTPDPILVIDAVGSIRITNDKVENVFGYQKQELSGQNFDLLIPARYKAAYEKQRAHIFNNQTDTSIALEIFTLHKNGSEFPVEVSFSRVESVDGLFIAVAIRDITARKQVELDLKQSNERNRIFVEQAPNALAMFDTQMRYMAASRKWLEDYNLVGKEIIGRSHYEIFPEIGEDWKTIHRECLKGAINKTDEAPFERADGTLQWITWDVRPWYIAAGQIGGLLMYTADITELKQKDAERRRIEYILERSNQIAKIAAWEVDTKTNAVQWGDMAFDIFDFPKGKMPDRETTFSLYKEGPNRDKLLAAVKKQIEHGTPYDLELEIVTPKGKQKWIRLIGEADFENGICKRRYGVFQDITMAKQAEEALNLANEELKAIFNSGYVSIIGTDTNGLITHFNHGAEKLLQYSSSEMIGLHTPAKIHLADEVINRGADLSILSGRTIEGFDVFVEMARQGRHESREWTYVRKDGSRFPVQLIVSSIKNAEGQITGFLGVATDITERKVAEEKMRNYSILESKSKEMEQFAYIASHDLREPLLTIKSYAKLLDEDFGDKLEGDGQQYIRSISKAIVRMEDLTKGLLEYSRLGQIKPLKEVNCNDVLSDVLADLHSLISTTNAAITIEPLPVVNGYPLELKLLFQNLLNNAIKFRKKDTAPVIHIAAAKVEGGWQFTVQDNGIGIAEKSRDKIFAMFQRLHNRDEYEGTGIGLAQCKKIVEMHQGKIWVDSEPGVYSKFHFTIIS